MSELPSLPEAASDMFGYLQDVIMQIDTDHPYLHGDPYIEEWERLGSALQHELDDPDCNGAGLRGIYENIKSFLRKVAEERHGIISMSRAIPLDPNHYLYGSYGELALRLGIAISRKTNEAVINTMAENLLMGHQPEELEVLAGRHAGELRNRIFELMIYDVTEAERVDEAIKDYGEEETLKLLREDDENLQLLAEDDESGESAEGQVAAIILAARQEIDYLKGKYADRLNHGEDTTGLAEIRGAHLKLVLGDK